MRSIGQKTARVDGRALAHGKPVFADDLEMRDLLYVKILHSPRAHARIRSIDTSAALAHEGVVTVLTHKDYKSHYYTTAGQGYPEPSPRDTTLLDRVVRFVGDRVAIIAAETPEAAQEALELVKVDYEALPLILDPEESRTAGTQIHPEPAKKGIHDAQHNIAAHIEAQHGDVEQALADSAHVFEGTYSTPYVQQAHIEPHISISWLDANERLIIRTSTQVPFHVRRIVAEVLDIPVSRIRVIKPRIGGGFGGKQEILNEEVVAAVTMRTGRPARIMYTREEEFHAARTRHPQKITLRIGVDEDGLFQAIDMDILENSGAYGTHALTVMSVTAQKGLSIYNALNNRVNGDAVYTNLPIAGAYRGYGSPQAFFPLESLVDEIAHEMGIDPVELRLKNIHKTGDDLPIARILGEGREGHEQILHSTELKACLEQGQKLSSWDQIRSSEQDGHLKRGVGLAIAGQGSGIPGIDMGAAFIKLNEDGSFNLQVGATDLGTGSDTALSQIAAEILEVDLEKIIIYSSDTDMTPFDTGAYASSTTYVSGGAVKKAAEQIRASILETGRNLLGDPLAEFEGDVLKGAKAELSYGEICTKAFYTEEQQQIMASASHMSYDSPPPFNATFAEVEVDTRSGLVRVVKVVSISDCGQIINPQMSEGQAEGAIPQALGMALTEFMTFDDEGRPQNTDFLNYHIYTAIDMPEMVVRFVESHEPTGPFGAKAVAEIPINAPAPAVTNAIFNACGVRIRHLPVRPEEILEGLEAKGQDS